MSELDRETDTCILLLLSLLLPRALLPLLALLLPPFNSSTSRMAEDATEVLEEFLLGGSRRATEVDPRLTAIDRLDVAIFCALLLPFCLLEMPAEGVEDVTFGFIM